MDNYDERFLNASLTLIILTTNNQVWDVVSNEKAVEIVSSASERYDAAKRLVEYAAGQWKHQRPGYATDDISVVCLFFHDASSSQEVEPC